MKIEIKDLKYQVGQKKILSIDQIIFEDNKMTGIIGPNGSGKTTFLKHLYRELPSKKSIYIDGKDISKYKNKEYSKIVSVLTQFHEGVDPNLEVEDVVLMGRYPHKGLFDKYDESDEKIINKVLEDLSLTKYRYRKLETLSGGELQRVMMAKIFATEPDLILLDEPTNHLDIKYKIEFMEILKAFTGPVIVSLHDLSLCARYCDEVIILKDGNIFAQGEPKEVLTESLLKKVYDVNYRVLYEPEFIIYY
ncbi:MAG: ABC transporter ATP-binding protein [Tissierellia bacterium]|nr:ABC transporter ATP-binding protein [Tissierellia bacterium]